MASGQWPVVSGQCWGQAALEMTAALIGALLLLFGSLKVGLWLTERLVARQRSYESTRVAAGSNKSDAVVTWTEPQTKLRILNESP